MQLNPDFKNELDAVFRGKSEIGLENFHKVISKLTRSEHKAAQNLRAKALRRALRRSRR